MSDNRPIHSPLPIKFCGFTRLENLREAVSLGVKAVGINLWPKSKRYISPNVAKTLLSSLSWVDRQKIEVWLVLVNVSVRDTISLMEMTGADVIQLHGDETPEFVSDLRRALTDADVSVRIIKALKADAGVFKRADAFDKQVDGFLLDAGVIGEYGGTGVCVDLEIATVFCRKYPTTALAGGLTPENVESVFRAVKPDWSMSQPGSKIVVSREYNHIRK